MYKPEEDEVRRRAQRLFEEGGRVLGHEVEDWLEAERELIEESVKAPAPPAYIVVKLNGVTYTGEYDPSHCDGYRPGEFEVSAPVRVRVDREQLIIQRPGGQQLQARIVRRSAAH